MKRLIAMIIVFLLLGAIVNVAVAWACAQYATAKKEQLLNEHPWPHPRVAGWPTMASHGLQYTGRALTVQVSRARGREEEHARHSPLFGQTSFGVGLPMLSMRWCLYGFMPEGRGTLDYWPSDVSGAWRSGIRPVRTVQDQWRFQRRLPLEPLATGFIINTLFYALLLWLLFFVPFAARRMLRRRRGLCEKCAYPVGVSPVCTECGEAVPRKAE